MALGKCGSREMTARSDLDLMTLYRPENPTAMSASKGWSAETFYARFTQRLVAALSAPTAEGGLYQVDLQLRPSGTSGPVAVSLKAFDGYYERAAETWELLALTRARIVWSSSEGFAQTASQAIETALRRPRDARGSAKDVLEMRELMERERPAAGKWDLKLSWGGLVDVEFAAQFLQIIHAAEGGPLDVNTAGALAKLADRGLVSQIDASSLIKAWRLQQDLSQLLRLALPANADPAAEPAGFRRLLARASGARDFGALQSRLTRSQVRAREAFVSVLHPAGHMADRPSG